MGIKNEKVIITLKRRFQNKNGFYLEPNEPTMARKICIEDKIFYATQNCIVEEEEIDTVELIIE